MLRLLLITDDNTEIKQFTHLVSKIDGMELLYQDNPKVGEVIQSISDNKPEVVILGGCNAQKTNYDFVVSLIERFVHIAFVISCSENHKEAALSLISVGAQDYLIRDHTDEFILEKTILAAIERENLRKKLSKAVEKELEARQYSNRLLSRMSHEIRTPMNAVIGMAEMLFETELTSKQRYYTQLIRESGNMLVSLFNDLLDYSKIESGQVKIHHRPMLLRQSMQETLETVLNQALEKKLDIILHIQPDLPYMMIGDALRIRQVVMNLIENAIKFTHAGYVKLKVNIDNQEEKSLLVIAVEDTGQGIRKDVLPQLFKPYVKGEEHEAAQIKGIGLGLAICDHLVKQMDGQIQVSSEPGKGTTFTVLLPLFAAEEDKPANELNCLENKHVLFLTHDNLLVELLSDYFHHWGAKFETRKEEQETPVFTDELKEYDLLITDLRANFKLDLKLVDRVRQRHPIPHILIKDREKVNDQLVVIRKDTVILLKPVIMHELLQTVKAVLNEEADVLIQRDHLPPADEHMGEYHPLEILVAEDNVINQKIILSVLSRFGYSPKLVENGKLAVESVQQKTYDLILMDIQMPVMNGIEATKRIIASVPESARPRIVALTADALQKSREEYQQNGMDDVLYKPVQTKDLLRVINETLHSRKNTKPEEF
ncbi:MAG: ATP-binding protein [Bacteroidales bacterium]|jgi:signal transduction histidine kinase/CheY-like chemotaxis protein|nr:ATP-binding protein [Bacteroidales bacterium]HOI31393.1 ATP-binding protein [Bacteroidales bacterium]